MLERVMKPGLYLGCMAWLGMRDSNPRMRGPEPRALPLGESPVYFVSLYVIPDAGFKVLVHGT